MSKFLNLPIEMKILIMGCAVLFVICAVIVFLWKKQADEISQFSVQVSNLKREIKSCRMKLETSERSLEEAKKELELYRRRAAIQKEEEMKKASGDISRDGAAAIPQASDQLPAEFSVDPKGIRILIAEDNEANRQMAVAILDTFGYQVQEAKDGKEAVELFAGSPEDYYHFILMDIKMPNMDGYEAAKEIRGMKREDSKKVPIVAMTANTFSSDIMAVRASGMNGHVRKPIDAHSLITTVNRLMKVR